MSKHIHSILTAACLVAVAPFASASVLNFDDLSGSDFFTANYHGFQIGNNDPATNPWFYSSETLYDTSGNVFYQAKSPTHYIATDYTLYDNSNPSQATLGISNTTAFLFSGAYVSGSDQIQYQLYGASNNLLFTSTPSAALSNTPIFVASGYAGLVNSVVVIGRQGFFALDDFTYNVTPAVPEPSTYALMALGLGAIGFAASRRRSQSK